MAALAGRSADIYITSGDQAGTSFTDEACAAVSGYPANTVYRISSTSKRLWSWQTAVTVKVNGSAVSATTYQLGRAGGIVVFGTALGGGDSVTVSGAYLSATQLGQGHEWSADVTIDTQECTTFGSTWKSHTVTLRGITMSITRCYLDEYFHTNLQGPYLVVLYMDQPTGTRIEAMCWLNTDSIKSGVSSLVEETVNFTGSEAAMLTL